ncbi:DUF6625 family protein [Endozoicomonas sp. 8E]|uniref:DUF6625 family protein n=1 Tax=Endozoicomonas sp. 8E TaxID=3035692 RepID=UPI0029390C11|nr:DUF6625 family protein [Endozoicomonas sp. 8E]
MQSKSDYKVILLSNYFGRWPFWIDFFFESCRRNTNYTWIIYTDCVIPDSVPNNIIFRPTSFEEYCHLVSKKLKINFRPSNPYKLCDIKPALGYIHSDDLHECDFWGYTDIDVIYGRLETFFTPEKMSKYDIISSGFRRVWGFLCLLRNSSEVKSLFKKVPDWKEKFEDCNHKAFDEKDFSDLFVKCKNFPSLLRKIINKFEGNARRVCFDEAWCNPDWKYGWIDGSTKYPKNWYWKNGILTNDLNGDREFSYLHFIHWKADEWRGISDCRSSLSLYKKNHSFWTINSKGISISE